MDDVQEAPRDLNPVPLLAAAVAFVVIVALAWIFLREDQRGRLVRPDRIEVTGDDTVRLRVFGPFDDAYADVLQVGYALGDDEVFVEVVLDEHGCPDDAGCGAPTEVVTAELVLPEPIGDREVVAGTGRALADCGPDTSEQTPTFRCVADR